MQLLAMRCWCRAARSSFTAKQSAENVAAVIEGALHYIPRKWSNVQSLFLRTAVSAALPIYQVRAHSQTMRRSMSCTPQHNSILNILLALLGRLRPHDGRALHVPVLPAKIWCALPLMLG